MRTSFPFLLLLASLVLLGCPYYPSYNVNFKNASIPDSSFNLWDLNSKYDDYNSAGPPTIMGYTTFNFSSNRRSKGHDFDILQGSIHLYFDQDNGRFSLWVDSATGPGDKYDQTSSVCDSTGSCSTLGFLESMDDSLDQLGPFLDVHDSLFFYTQQTDSGWKIMARGVLPVYDWANVWYNGVRGNGPLAMLWAPFNLPGHDDGYLAVSGKGDYAVFTSNRGGDFDLYEVDFPDSLGIRGPTLDSNSLVAKPIATLNTSGDEKCSFLNGDTLLFVSNGPASIGGFDAFYSIRQADKSWSAPKPIPGVNTSYDEYRPILMRLQREDQADTSAGKWLDDLLIFSSNRPGGKGGFDLYAHGWRK